MPSLSVELPWGQDGHWRTMRDLDAAQGAFTISDVDARSNVSRYSVEHYVKRLAKGGFLKPVGEQKVPGNHANAVLYRLVRKPAVAPRVSKAGVLLGPSVQQRLWRSMRVPAGRAFNTRELAFEATLDVPVALKTAQRYINQLVLAGYLVHLHRSTYRLKPAMNTGPLPPSILKIEAVYDRNTKKIIGRGRATEGGES